MKEEFKKEAIQKWVSSFYTIPKSLIEKAYIYNNKKGIREITPVKADDLVYSCSGKHIGRHGVVTKVDKNETEAEVSFYVGIRDRVNIKDLDVEHECFLAEWDFMWIFKEDDDIRWIGESENLRLMANCGFRIHKIEEGYIFGVDGYKYDNYESYLVSLYYARHGLR